MTTNKRLLCIWYDSFGVLYYELLRPGETVNSTRYAGQVQKVYNACNQRPANQRHPVVFLHDNATSHTSHVVRNLIEEFGWEILKHPPNSPDLNPVDFSFNRGLHTFLKSTHSNNAAELQQNIENYINSKDESFYQKGIHSLPERWQWVAANNGEYYPD